MDDEDSPYLTAFLKIQPPRIASGFWSSDEYKHFIRHAHNWAIYFLFVSTPFLLRRLWMQPQSRFIVVLEVANVVHLLVQARWYRFIQALPPDSSFTEKQFWMSSTRYLHAFLMIPLAVGVRRSTNVENIQAMAMNILYEVQEQPSWLVSFRNVLVVTGGVWPFFHGIASPLMFFQQLGVGLFELVVLWSVHMPVAMNMLSNAGPTSGIHKICSFINEVQYVVEAILFGVPMDFHYRSEACASDHVAVVSVFIFILACCIPLYIGYRLEWYLKMQYLHRMWGGCAKVRLPIFTDTLFIASFITTTWVMCMCWRTSLAGLLVPLPSNA